MNTAQIADFEKRFQKKFKDVVSIKHIGYIKEPVFTCRDGFDIADGYDLFELVKADGTVQEIKVG